MISRISAIETSGSSITRTIARAVALAACESGVARGLTADDVDAALDHEIWDLDYPALRPI